MSGCADCPYLGTHAREPACRSARVHAPLKFSVMSTIVIEADDYVWKMSGLIVAVVGVSVSWFRMWLRGAKGRMQRGVRWGPGSHSRDCQQCHNHHANSFTNKHHMWEMI